MKKILLSTLVLALTACTPTLQEASAWLSPSSVELQRGNSTEVSLNFVDRAQRDAFYTVSSAYMTDKGVSLSPIGSSIITGQSGTVRFKVNASQTAELGKHTFQVLLTGKEGRLQQTLTVNIRP